MEKRCRSELARAVETGRYCLKITLILILLLPGSLIAYRSFLRVNEPDAMKISLKPRQKNLARIYSIVKSNRPDMKESQARKISNAIFKESTKYRLDPILVLALIDVESKFQHQAVSSAGARGLMQILPGTGKALVREIGLAANSDPNSFKPEFLDDPILNIKLGIYYLQHLKKTFQSLNKALIAYNLGPTELKNRLDNHVVYPGGYAASVLHIYQKYKESRLPTF
jgi:soluble lytic murein transglycosylase-like protein